MFRHHSHVVERGSIDIYRNSSWPIRSCDEYLPFPLLVAEAEEVCLIIYLKIQQLFVLPKKCLATDVEDLM